MNKREFKVTQQEILTRAEMIALMAECKTIEELLFCRLGLYSGLRISEIIKLGPQDLIHEKTRCVLHIRDSKGGKSRHACIDPATFFILRVTPSPWFSKTDRFYQLMIKRLAAAAGIQDKTITPHTLRHTNITMLLARGMPLEKVRLHAGHEKIETTMIYTHLVWDPVARSYEEAIGY